MTITTAIPMAVCIVVIKPILRTLRPLSGSYQEIMRELIELVKGGIVEGIFGIWGFLVQVSS